MPTLRAYVELLEQAIACARTRGAAELLSATWADAVFRLELAERATLAHHPDDAAAAGSGVAPPADFTLASHLIGRPRSLLSSY